MQLNIRNEFSAAPGPRYRAEGKHSGEEFREGLLVPRLRAAIQANEKLVVNLDGTAGYATSFLEESFGGLIRVTGIAFPELEGVLEFVSTEEPQLVQEIMDYMRDAQRESDPGGGAR